VVVDDEEEELPQAQRTARPTTIAVTRDFTTSLLVKRVCN